MNATSLISPCHQVPCCGGPARVWCSRCGAGYQADDPRLERAGAPASGPAPGPAPAPEPGRRAVLTLRV